MAQHPLVQVFVVLLDLFFFFKRKQIPHCFTLQKYLGMETKSWEYAGGVLKLPEEETYNHKTSLRVPLRRQCCLNGKAKSLRSDRAAITH